MEQKHFHFNEKKRVVVKIGSSSLNYGETGNLNFTKLEHLVRELCNLRNRGMDVCLVSSARLPWATERSAWMSGRRTFRQSRHAQRSVRRD